MLAISIFTSAPAGGKLISTPDVTISNHPFFGLLLLIAIPLAFMF
jgi:hypothetical protein